MWFTNLNKDIFVQNHRQIENTRQLRFRSHMCHMIKDDITNTELLKRIGLYIDQGRYIFNWYTNYDKIFTINLIDENSHINFSQLIFPTNDISLSDHIYIVEMYNSRCELKIVHPNKNYKICIEFILIHKTNMNILKHIHEHITLKKLRIHETYKIGVNDMNLENTFVSMPPHEQYITLINNTTIKRLELSLDYLNIREPEIHQRIYNLEEIQFRTIKNDSLRLLMDNTKTLIKISFICDSYDKLLIVNNSTTLTDLNIIVTYNEVYNTINTFLNQNTNLKKLTLCDLSSDLKSFIFPELNSALEILKINSTSCTFNDKTINSLNKFISNDSIEDIFMYFSIDGYHNREKFCECFEKFPNRKAFRNLVYNHDDNKINFIRYNARIYNKTLVDYML